MNFNLSYWERQTYAKDSDIIIIGAGIVGINAAISLKQADPEKDVLIIDRGILPMGASTKNAGFACFGSVTELVDDLCSSSEECVFDLLRERIAGLNYLRERVGDHNLSYEACGGYEVFDTEEELETLRAQIPRLNKKIYEVAGLENAFSLKSSSYSFKHFYQRMIYNRYEGALNPGLMMWHLKKQALALQIRFMNGITVESIQETEDSVNINAREMNLKCKNLLVCTNGFTNSITYESKIDKEKTALAASVIPARNQVLVTEPIAGIKLDSCFHYDKGYVYFRNIDQRILIGGGRNISASTEETTDFGQTQIIRDYLINILVNKIGIDPSTKIEYEWSGIMGTGPVKSPILRKLSEHIIFAVRLGGMGVALGSLLGDKAAKLLLNNIENKGQIRS